MKRSILILLSLLTICALFLPACEQIEGYIPEEIEIPDVKLPDLVSPQEKPAELGEEPAKPSEEVKTDKPTQEPALEVDTRIISVEVGKTGVIQVAASQGNGSQDTVTAEPSNDHVSAIVAADGSISVVGSSLGETELTIKSGSGLTKTVKVRVDDPKALIYDGLAITFTDQFDWMWDDRGSGGDFDGSYWHPISPEGYYALGSLGINKYGDPRGNTAVIVVKDIDSSGVLAAPTDYERIWADSGSGANRDGSFWKPVAPTGYVALGVVAMGGYGKPSLDAIRCVKKELTANAKIGDRIWIDKGTGADTDFGSWEVAPPDAPNTPGMAYLKPGTFVAYTSHGAPSSHSALNVLNVKLPVITDMSDANYAPRLNSYDEPPASTDSYLAKVIAVPFTIITDKSYDTHWKVENSPIYKVRWEEYYNNKFFYNNRDGSSPITHTVTDTVGISQEESTTYWQTVGISISSEFGCELIGGGVTVELSYEFGYESTSSRSAFEEHEVSREVVIPANTAGCLWQKTTKFTLMRNSNNWEDVAGSVNEITIDSFVKGEYPH
ncbi:Vps62-related protein [Chloroflexota bacterium]